MNTLSKLDSALLFELDSNARQSLSTIAKKLRTSQQVISYRIQSLEKRGVIDGYFTVINFSRLGYTNYRIMIRLSNINEQAHTAIIDYLKRHKNVLWLVDCSGKWDLIVNLMAKTVFELNQDIKHVRSTFPEQIQNYDVLTMVEVVWFGRSYLFGRKRELRKSMTLGSDFKPCAVDKKDLRILSSLSDQARMSVLDIAKKTAMSTKTVLKRIQRLQAEGIILGFKPLIHLEYTPFTTFKALIKFQNLTEKKEKEILQYLTINEHVVGQLKFIGLWDFEVEFEVENRDQVLEFTRAFRDLFKDVIKEFETLQLNREYKYNFLAKDCIRS